MHLLTFFTYKLIIFKFINHFIVLSVLTEHKSVVLLGPVLQSEISNEWSGQATFYTLYKSMFKFFIILIRTGNFFWVLNTEHYHYHKTGRTQPSVSNQPGTTVDSTETLIIKDISFDGCKKTTFGPLIKHNPSIPHSQHHPPTLNTQTSLWFVSTRVNTLRPEKKMANI